MCDFIDYGQFGKSPLFSDRLSREINRRSKKFFKVFANFGDVDTKIWWSQSSYEQNDIIFFIPLVGNLPENEECLSDVPGENQFIKKTPLNYR